MAAAAPPGPQVPDAEPGSGRSPTVITRRQEKEMLQGLNNRLVVYIDRMQSLQRENSVLRQRVSKREEVSRDEVSGLRAVYEARLAENRQVLDETSRERAKLQVDLRRSRDDHNELLARYAKMESDFNGAQVRIQELEAALNSKEAAVAGALDSKRSLEQEAEDLKAQVAELQVSLASFKDELARETLAKVDLVNRLQTAIEDLEFRKNMHKKEMNEAKRRIVTLLAQAKSDHQAEYEQRLAQALREIREQHNIKVQQYKDDLEQSYRARLDNAVRFAEMSNFAASSVRDELNANRVRMASLCSHIAVLQREAIAWHDRAQELEEILSKEQEDYHKILYEKEKEVREMRNKMQEQLSDYEQLLDVKLALDMEISAYQQLLETEEERLEIPLRPSSLVTVSRASLSQNVHTNRQKRRRTDMAAYDASVCHTASATGNVSIEEIDIDGKFIRLKNTSEQDQPMGGWELTREIRGISVSYRYSSGYILQAGQTVTLWAANAGITGRPPTDLIWENENSWDTREDVKVVLKNSLGAEVAERLLFFRINISEGEEEDEMENEPEKQGCYSQKANPKLPARNCVMM